jgi:hypothetical protein
MMSYNISNTKFLSTLAVKPNPVYNVLYNGLYVFTLVISIHSVSTVRIVYNFKFITKFSDHVVAMII